jgi:hypothetical protein
MRFAGKPSAFPPAVLHIDRSGRQGMEALRSITPMILYSGCCNDVYAPETSVALTRNAGTTFFVSRSVLVPVTSRSTNFLALRWLMGFLKMFEKLTKALRLTI